MEVETFFLLIDYPFSTNLPMTLAQYYGKQQMLLEINNLQAVKLSLIY